MIEDRYQATLGARAANVPPALCMLFACLVWRDGGTTDGDSASACDRTYTARTLDATSPTSGGLLLGQTLTPKRRRPDPGMLDVPSDTGSGVVGVGYYDLAGAFCLWDANETLATDGCV